MPALPRLCCLIALFAGIAACDDYPRDPDGTLERVRGGVMRVGVMRVGVIHDPPFVLADGGPPQGREADLVRSHARALGARIAWRREGAGTLMHELQQRRLDAVIGGHVDGSPWAERVSLSREYRVRDAQGRLVRRAVALPPGENGWQVAFERHAASPAARTLLERPAR